MPFLNPDFLLGIRINKNLTKENENLPSGYTTRASVIIPNICFFSEH